MTTPLDLNGIQRVCDDQGRTVAVVLANHAFERLTAENSRLREEAAELRRALDAAREELKDRAATTAQRDTYLKSLQALTREDWTVTAQEMVDLDKKGAESNRQFMDELDSDLRSLQRRDG